MASNQNTGSSPDAIGGPGGAETGSSQSAASPSDTTQSSNSTPTGADDGGGATAPTSPVQGVSGSPGDVSDLTGVATGLLGGVTSAGSLGSGLPDPLQTADALLSTPSGATGGLGNSLNALTASQAPIIQGANDAVLDFHSLLESAGHATGTSGTLHGLVGTGETAGLGHIGSTNLVTDVAQAPGDLVNGTSPQTIASNIVTDAGNTAAAADMLGTGAQSDLANPNLVPTLVTGLVDHVIADPSGVTDGLNQVAGDVLSGAGLNGITDTAQNPLDTVNGAVASAVGDTGVPPVIDGLADMLGGTGGTGGGAGGSSGGGHAIAVDSNIPGSAPLLDAGVLTTPDSGATTNADVGNAPNGTDGLLGDLVPTGGGNGQGTQGSTGDHIVAASADAPVGASLLDAGVLTTPDSGAPINADVGNAPNSTDGLLGGLGDLVPTGGGSDQAGTGGHIVAASADAPVSSPLLDAGVLTTPDSGAPINADVGNAPNGADGLLGGLGDLVPTSGGSSQGSAADHVVAASAGSPDSAPLADAGVLAAPDTQGPLNADVGNGANVADASLLSHDDLTQTPALNGVDGLGDVLSTSGSDSGAGTGDHLVSAGAGAPDGQPLADAGVLTTPDTQSPVTADLGNGANIADANLLSHDDLVQIPALSGANGLGDGLGGVLPTSAGGGEAGAGDQLVTASAGAPADQPLADAGVLTTPDSGAPVNADVANGTNIADASLLSHDALLQVPALGGTGTDALAGVVPSALGSGDGIVDLGAAPATTDASPVPPAAVSDPGSVDLPIAGAALADLGSIDHSATAATHAL